MLMAYSGAMESHLEIIRRFGGVRGLAEKLGHNTHGTVSGWSRRKHIPVAHWPKLVAAAEQYGIDFDMSELMPSELVA